MIYIVYKELKFLTLRDYSLSRKKVYIDRFSINEKNYISLFQFYWNIILIPDDFYVDLGRQNRFGKLINRFFYKQLLRFTILPPPLKMKFIENQLF